jgi:RNA polymerase sigma-70 factor (ECF subfamily)
MIEHSLMAQTNRTTHSPDDIQLLQRVGRQDQDALMQLYQRYGNLVYSLAMRVLREQGLAEEVTQDIFLKLWRHPERWNPALGQFTSWLMTITRNAAIDRLRTEQRKPDLSASAGETLENRPMALTGADDPLWFDGQLLRRLMGNLPAEQRQVIELAYFLGFTHSELAEHLGLPLGTVKTRLRIGLQKLKVLWLEASQK